MAKRFLKKAARDGITEALRIAFRETKRGVVRLTSGVNGLRHLKEAGFATTFVHEGNIRISVPRASLVDAVIPNRIPTLEKAAIFIARPYSEPAMRLLARTLIEENLSQSKADIVDIGAWISDNALVWGRMVEPLGGRVVAIDPSPENVEFGRKLCALNHVRNVDYHVAVCTDTIGTDLWPTGSLDHTEFTQSANPRQRPLKSMTIDGLIDEQRIRSVGLLHVDVEGLEAKVIAGASTLIANSRPLIIFEQHLETDDVAALCSTLESWNYSVQMVNESLPGCLPDCRNFLAIPAESFLNVCKTLSKLPGIALVNWTSI